MPTLMPFLAIALFLLWRPFQKLTETAPSCRGARGEYPLVSLTLPTDNKAARRRPCCRQTMLPLRVLRATPRLVQAHLLALDRARVARHQARLLQDRFERRVVLDQGARDAV